MKKLRLFCFSLLWLAFSGTITAQNVTVTGTVTDGATGEPLPYTTVHVDGTSIGTATDAKGFYSINAPASATLVYSFVGYQTLQEAIGNRIRIDVRLEPESNLMGDIVVTAYGTARRESVTGSISSVSAEDIEKRSGTSVLSALEGNVTGISIIQGGAAGSTPEIRIRGYTSVTGSNAPLYVVDGAPLAGNIQDLNPQDIENISVLKDAASAALYGNRASNGVIIVTTKRGKNQGGNIRVNMTQGIYSRAVPDYDLMGADDFMETAWLGYYNYFRSNPDELAKYPDASQAAAYVTENLITDKLKYNIYDKPANQVFDQNGKLVASVRPQYTDLDWWDEVKRLGYRQEYHISADAASEKSSYYISAGYLDEKGYIKYNAYQRFTAKANVSMTPKTWLTLNLNIDGTHQITDNITADGTTSYGNPHYFAKNIAPIYPIYLHDMDTGDFILDAEGNRQYDNGSEYSRPQWGARHTIWENELNSNKGYRTTLRTTGGVTVRFLKDFSFNVSVDASLRNTENKIYDNSIVGDGQGSNGRAGGNNYRYLTITGRQQLNWNRTFDRHNVDAMVAHESYQSDYDYKYFRVSDETFYGNWDISNFNSYTTMTGYDNKVRTESYFGRVRYNYDNKYFMEAMFRRDGSSRFHPDHRWGNFWSLGGSWSIHREKFMMPLQNTFNTLRLRASYGQVGNDRGVNAYGYMGLYGLYTNGGKGAAYKSQNEAPTISWETLASWGVALEGRLINRINFEVEYFDKESRDMLFNVQMPLSVGSNGASTIGATQTINQGNMANRGIEISVDVDVIRKPDLSWNVSATGTYMKNKITKLPEQMVDYNDGNRIRQIGKPLYNWYIRERAGVDQMTGRELYYINEELYPDGLPNDAKEFEVEINGVKYSSHYTYARRTYAGAALPKFSGSVGTSLRWKNFNFSVLCTYSLGGKMLDSRYNTYMSLSETPSAIHKDLLKAWNGVPAGMTETSPDRIDPNGIAAVDFYYNGYRTNTNTFMLQDMTYFSIRNVNVSYSLPKKLVEVVDLSSVTLSLGVENLWFSSKLKGMNPQQTFAGTTSNVYDTSRIVSLGLNVRF